MLRVFLSIVCLIFIVSCSNKPKSSFVELEAENLEFNLIKKNVQLFLEIEKIVIHPNSTFIFWGGFDCVQCTKETYFSRIRQLKGEVNVLTSNKKLIEELNEEFQDLNVIEMSESKLKAYKINFKSPVIVTKISNKELVVEDL
jgi:hypothetical protein